MPRVLMVEDEPRIVEAVEKTLSMAKSFLLKAISDPDKVIATALQFKPDLILLDVKLPGGDGRMVLKSLKQHAAARSIPVIMLTGMASEGDKVVGLNLGADDYVVKPFGAMELLARIQAALRRVRPEPGTPRPRSHGGLKLDRENRLATLDGHPLKLQPKEFEILYLLASQPGKSLTRAYLIENSSSYGLPISTRSLDTHIKNLRKKLGGKAELIQTVPKLGYRFGAPDA